MDWHYSLIRPKKPAAKSCLFDSAVLLSIGHGMENLAWQKSGNVGINGISTPEAFFFAPCTDYSVHAVQYSTVPGLAWGTKLVFDRPPPLIYSAFLCFFFPCLPSNDSPSAEDARFIRHVSTVHNPQGYSSCRKKQPKRMTGDDVPVWLNSRTDQHFKNVFSTHPAGQRGRENYDRAEGQSIVHRAAASS